MNFEMDKFVEGNFEKHVNELKLRQEELNKH